MKCKLKLFEMTRIKHKIEYIKDSELGNLNIPASLCIFQNNNAYSLVEINTGYDNGSIKVISRSYKSIKELQDAKIIIKNPYPFLQNHIIYNDKIMSAL